MASSSTGAIKKQKPPYYKVKATEQETTPAHMSRQSLADVIKFNLETIGRRHFYQRIVMITKHQNTSGPFLKDTYAKAVGKSKNVTAEEKMAALFLLFDCYTVQILEGPEEILNSYFVALAPFCEKSIKKSKILLIYNNINQRFFGRVIWRIAEFPNTTEKLPQVSDPKLYRCHSLLIKIHELCKRIKEEEQEESAGFKSSYLSTDYRPFTPTAEQLDAILEIPELQSIEDYANTVTQYPSYESFSEEVWPVPLPPVPQMHAPGKYDVNLYFPIEKDEKETTNKGDE